VRDPDGNTVGPLEGGPPVNHRLIRLAAVAALTAAVALRAVPQPPPKPQPKADGPAPPSRVIFQNVRLFDGRSDRLADGMNVLVEGNTIVAVTKDPIPAPKAEGARVIAGNGRVLMPGMID